MDSLNIILNKVKDNSIDVKAEFIVAILLEIGYSINDIVVSQNGQHKRSWTKELADIDRTELSNGEERIVLNLNQDGIYDSLPEALFHSNIHDKADAGKEMAGESMKLKIEEKEARKFFTPFENAIFSQKINLASKENSLLKKLNSDLLQGIIPNFWKINGFIPEKYKKRLITLIPFAHKIIGNYDLTAQALSYIIQENVEFELRTFQKNQLEDEMQKFRVIGLGRCILGVDLICGSNINGLINHICFIIGPVNKISIDQCLQEGSLNKLLNCFYDYFVPYELDISTEFIFKEELNNTYLSDGKFESYLGYNTVLKE